MSDALAACEGRSAEKRKDLVLIVCITLRRWTVTAHARSTSYQHTPVLIRLAMSKATCAARWLMKPDYDRMEILRAS
jgi:hypothetical protein